MENTKDIMETIRELRTSTRMTPQEITIQIAATFGIDPDSAKKIVNREILEAMYDGR